MTEHEIQLACINLIRKRGGIVTRVNSGGTIAKRGGHLSLAEKGTSDLIACFGGKYLAIEVKDTGKVATSDQREFGRMVNRAGGIFLVIDDIDKLSRELDLLERGEQ